MIPHRPEMIPSWQKIPHRGHRQIRLHIRVLRQCLTESRKQFSKGLSAHPRTSFASRQLASEWKRIPICPLKQAPTEELPLATISFIYNRRLIQDKGKTSCPRGGFARHGLVRDGELGVMPVTLEGSGSLLLGMPGVLVWAGRPAGDWSAHGGDALSTEKIPSPWLSANYRFFGKRGHYNSWKKNQNFLKNILLCLLFLFLYPHPGTFSLTFWERGRDRGKHRSGPGIKPPT